MDSIYLEEHTCLLREWVWNGPGPLELSATAPHKVCSGGRHLARRWPRERKNFAWDTVTSRYPKLSDSCCCNTNWLPLENGSSFQNTSKHFKTHIFINFSLYSFSHTIDLGMAFSAFKGSECCSAPFHITQERIFSLQIVMIFTFAFLAVWFQILLTFYFLSLFKKYRFALALPDFTLR